MKKIIVTSISIFLIIHAFSQSSFEYIYQFEDDHIPIDLIEDNNENIIVSFLDWDKRSSNLIKISSTGSLLNSYSISEPNKILDLKELILAENNTIIGIGVVNCDTAFYIRFCRFDEDLNLIYEQLISTEYPILVDRMNAIINTQGNVIIGATYAVDEVYHTGICMFKFNQFGDLILQKYFYSANPGERIFYDLFEIPNSSNYKIFTRNFYEKNVARIYTVDTAFNIISSHPFNWYLSDYLTAKLIDDESYLLGLNRFESKDVLCNGLVKHSHDEVVIDSILICDDQVLNFNAWIKSVDLINSSNIYFGSTHNLNVANPYFSTYPSWFRLNKLDENLDTVWQKYYGGDAYYNLWTLLATQDGGCVMAGTRYDHLIQDEERDVYVLKVNEDGLITWTHNIPIQESTTGVFPNPGINNVIISSYENNSTFELFDMHGQRVYEKGLSGIKETLNISHIPEGIYIYKITDSHGSITATGKWIKE